MSGREEKTLRNFYVNQRNFIEKEEQGENDAQQETRSLTVVPGRMGSHCRAAE